MRLSPDFSRAFSDKVNSFFVYFIVKFSSHLQTVNSQNSTSMPPGTPEVCQWFPYSPCLKQQASPCTQTGPSTPSLLLLLLPLLLVLLLLEEGLLLNQVMLVLLL